MSCHVSLLKNGRPKEAVSCSDCGARDLKDFFTSKAQGYHLCPACFQARTARGSAKEVEGT